MEGTGESCGVRQRSLSCKKSTGGTGRSVMALIYSSLDAMKLSECAFPSSQHSCPFQTVLGGDLGGGDSGLQVLSSASIQR